MFNSVESGLFSLGRLSCTVSAGLKSIRHIEGDFVSGAFLVAADAKGRAEAEFRGFRIAFVYAAVLSLCLGSFEHLVIGQPLGCRAFVTVHSVCFVMGDFLESVAVFRKLVPQRRVNICFFISCF